MATAMSSCRQPHTVSKKFEAQRALRRKNRQGEIRYRTSEKQAARPSALQEPERAGVLVSRNESPDKPEACANQPFTLSPSLRRSALLGDRAEQRKNGNFGPCEASKHAERRIGLCKSTHMLEIYARYAF